MGGPSFLIGLLYLAPWQARQGARIWIAALRVGAASGTRAECQINQNIFLSFLIPQELAAAVNNTHASCKQTGGRLSVSRLLKICSRSLLWCYTKVYVCLLTLPMPRPAN